MKKRIKDFIVSYIFTVLYLIIVFSLAKFLYNILHLDPYLSTIIPVCISILLFNKIAFK